MREETKAILLLIEDNDDHAELAEFYINEYDDSIQTRRLQDGKFALDYFEQLNSEQGQLPWLILLDLKLPKYDGHEVLKRLKNDSKLMNIPVIIFSTSNSNKDISTAMHHHANSYIVKPMEPDAYGKVIHNILQYWDLNQHYLIVEKTNEK